MRAPNRSHPPAPIGGPNTPRTNRGRTNTARMSDATRQNQPGGGEPGGGDTDTPREREHERYDNKPMLYIKDGARFLPVDWRAGTPVTRRIFATMFTPAEKLAVERDLAHPKNAQLVWEWRK